MKISKENLDKVKSANIANILKRVKEGKVLTAHEQKQLDSIEKEVVEVDKSATSTRKVAQSMKQASSWWGVPVVVMKKAKADGCPAFVEHRIHRDELLKWISENPSTSASRENDDGSTAEELKRQKLLSEVAILRIKVAKEEGTSMSKEQVKAEWARCMAIVHEEARNVINDDDRYRTFCNRLKAGIEGGEDQ